MRMPEEINRLVTDSISDWFFVTEPAGRDNLLREGKREDRVFFVGHVMVDNLFYQRDKLEHADRSGFESEALKRRFECYGAVTLHRPSNVDDRDALAGIAVAVREISARLPLIFPVHPRTRGNLDKFGLNLGPNVILTKPLSYMDFLKSLDASLITTDSGNSERPVTIDEGTNTIVGCDPSKIIQAAVALAVGRIFISSSCGPRGACRFV